MMRACVYSRTSNPDDKRDASLDSQEQATVAVLRGLGYTVEPGDLYRERDSSKDNNRPVLIEIKAKMASGYYQAIGIYCLDRFVRSQVHCAILFDELESLGVKVVSATNDIGDGSSEGKLILAIRAYLAESERIKIAERMNRGKRYYREQGQFVKLGVTRIGFDWVKGTRRRVVNPDEAPIVREIFERSAAGDSNNAIARDFTSRGVAGPCVRRGKRGKRWTAWNAALVREILQDPAYKGWTVVNRYERRVTVDPATGRKKRRTILRPQDDWLILDREGVITERLVEESVWDEANRRSHERVNNMAASKSPWGKAQVHLLRGIAWCGVCGHKLYPQHCRSTRIRKRTGDVEPPRPSYICQTRHRTWAMNHRDVPACGMPLIRSGPLDEAVWDVFHDLVVTPDLLASAVARLEEAQDTTALERELEAANRVLARKEKSRDTFYLKWRRETEAEDGDESFASKLEADYRALTPEIDAYRATVQGIEQRIAASRRDPSAVDQFHARFATLKEALIEGNEVTWSERWELLRIAEVRVVATPDRFDLYTDLFGVGPGPKPEGTSGSSIRFRHMPSVTQSLALH